MKRVLYLTTNSKMGGTERVIFNLARHFHGRDYAVHVATLMGPGTLQELLAAEGVPATHLEMRSKIDVPVILRLRRLLREFEPDLFCTYLFHANHLGRIVARLSGFSRIITVQESADLWRRWHHNIPDRATAGLVSQFIANSEAVKTRFCAFARVGPERVRVIHNGIDLAPYRDPDPATRAEARAELGLAEGEVAFITVAHVFAYKGYFELVAAAEEVARQHPEARWLFVGSGRADEAVRDRIRAAGLENRVRMLGIRTDVPRLLQAADGFVLPSHWEGCPLSLLEAMAAGLPVIASRVGGIPELVTEGETGLLTPPGEAGPLADAMAGLVEDGNTRASLGARGRERALAEFGLETQLERTRDVYEEVLSRG